MLPKPNHLAPQYGAQFQDRSVVEAYSTRPPYPSEVFDILLGLIRDEPRIVLDMGCGAGDIARTIAPRVDHVDAVDPSTSMLAKGKSLPGGDHPHLQWINAMAEEFEYPLCYSLIVTAQSLHWMDWYAVLPKIGEALTPNGRLAIVHDRNFINVPWKDQIYSLVDAFSTNREYQSYDLLEELQQRDLFVPERSVQTIPIRFSQSVDDYIESFHSRNGLSRQRMEERAQEFDERLRSIITQYVERDRLEFDLVVTVSWGLPR